MATSGAIVLACSSRHLAWETQQTSLRAELPEATSGRPPSGANPARPRAICVVGVEHVASTAATESARGGEIEYEIEVIE